MLFRSAGVTVVVHTGVTMWLDAERKESVRSFLQQCPPWLLPLLSTRDALKQSEYATLLDLARTSPQDLEIRRKLLFSMFVHELRNDRLHHLLRECTIGVQSPALMSDFYEKDFKTFLFPYITSRLATTLRERKAARPAVEGAYDLEIPQNYFADPVLSEVEIRKALVEAAFLYRQHLREKRYLFNARELSEAKAILAKDPSQEEVRKYSIELGARMLQLGSQPVDDRTMYDLYKTVLASSAPDYSTQTIPEKCLHALRYSPRPIITPSETSLGREINLQSGDTARRLFADNDFERFTAKDIIPLLATEPEAREANDSTYTRAVTVQAIRRIAPSINAPEVSIDLSEGTLRKVLSEYALQYTAKSHPLQRPLEQKRGSIQRVYLDAPGVSDEHLHMLFDAIPQHKLLAVIVTGGSFPKTMNQQHPVGPVSYAHNYQYDGKPGSYATAVCVYQDGEEYRFGHIGAVSGRISGVSTDAALGSFQPLLPREFGATQAGKYFWKSIEPQLRSSDVLLRAKELSRLRKQAP